MSWARSEKGATLRLTRIGRDLARLPIDPRFGRMVIESKTQAVSREVLAIVAGITIQDPRERPLEKRRRRPISSTPASPTRRAISSPC